MNTTEPAVELATMQCTDCRADLPLDRFRFRSLARQTRMRQCNACFAQRMRRLRRRHRDELLYRFTLSVYREQRPKKINAIACEYARRFGGQGRFGIELAGYMDRLREAGRMSRLHKAWLALAAVIYAASDARGR